MKVKLSDIAKVQFGVYSKPDEKGAVLYLHAKYFDELGEFNGEVDTYLLKGDKNKSHILWDGDILFAGKGFRNFAWTYTSEIGEAVASSIFFVIRPNKEKVFPEFLTTLFNTRKYQAYFQSLGAGSKITSIRKSELEALSFELPTIDIQKKIVEIKKMHQRDLSISKEIIEQKELKFQSLINHLLNT